MGNDPSKDDEHNDNRDASRDDFDNVLTKSVDPVISGVVDPTIKKSPNDRRTGSRFMSIDELRKSFKEAFSSDYDETGEERASVSSRVRASFHELRRSFNRALSWRKHRDTSTSSDLVPLNDSEKQQLVKAQQTISKGEAPKLINGDSNFLKIEAIAQVDAMLPESLQGSNWVLLYSLLRDGSSYTTFFEKIRLEDRLLVCIQTLDDEMFGGYNSTGWKTHFDYFGTGESWVFKVENFSKETSASEETQKEQAQVVRRFEWTGMNNYYMHCTDSSIGMGGGGEGFAFYLGDDFNEGTTAKSDTYCNDLLASTSTFKVANLEVWGFTSEATEIAARIARLKQLKEKKKKKENDSFL